MQQSITAALVGAGLGLAALCLLARLLPSLVPEVELRIEPWLALAALAGSLLMAILGGLFPAHLATRVAPMEALRR
jgi:ABC-type antimicrobial peptide transport system permease subunit